MAWTKTVLVLCFSLPLMGCAAMRQAHVDRVCNYDGAYAWGMNEARDGTAMNPAFLDTCPPETQAVAKQGYREGYTAGASGTTVVVAGRQAQPHGPECVRAYGKKQCGYHCVEAYGEIACAEDPRHTCVEAYGKVRCGPNCRKGFGDIVCD